MFNTIIRKKKKLKIPNQSFKKTTKNKYLKTKEKSKTRKKIFVTKKQKKNLNNDNHHKTEVNHGTITKLSSHNLKYSRKLSFENSFLIY